MKKRITLALALVLATVLQLSAVAVSLAVPMESINATVEVQRALAGITDVAVTQAQREKVVAYVTDELGNQQAVDVAITIREMPTKGRSSEKLYAMTAVAETPKYDFTPSINENIKVIAYGTIYYSKSYVGTVTTLHRVDGGWTPSAGSTVSNRFVSFGSRGLGQSSNTIRPSGNTFAADSGKSLGQVGMETSATVARSGTSHTETLELVIRS